MREGRSKFNIPSRAGSTGVIYIPADVVKDSSFPFQQNEEIVVKIEGEKLIIERDRKR
ncbi:MAG: hypothetical protein QXG01_07025 [Candidatus Bathyarchaeia archaeon]